MTNEELVTAIQSGQRNRLPELWDQVERFIFQQAGKRARALNGYGGVTQEDLYQCGYFALLAAVETFTPGEGSFIGWLAFALRNTFAEAAGYKSKKRDPLNMAASLDMPLENEDGGGTATLGDLQADENAAQDFENAEQGLWQEQLHTALENALAQLPADGQATIQARFYEGHTLADTAAAAGVSVEAVRGRIRKAIEQLRRNRRLLEFIEVRTPYYRHVGVSSFNNTWISATESVVLERERLEALWIANHSPA